MQHIFHRRALLGLAAATFAIAGCGNDVTHPDPAITAAVALDGNSQVAPPGAELPTPLTVMVTDQSSEPFSGAVVSWTVTAGSGSLDQNTTTTTEGGTAHVTWTLGPETGTQTVTATVEGLAPIVFTASAEPETAAKP